MEVIVFEVQGSAPKPYRVSFFKRSNSNFSAHCTCAAGENGQYCKHRLTIMDGDRNGIVSNNADDIAIIQSWLVDTDVEKALVKLRSIEKEAERIKSELTLAKRILAKSMQD